MPRKTAPGRRRTARSRAGTKPVRSDPVTKAGRPDVPEPRRASTSPPTTLPEQAPPAPTDDFYARGLTDGLPIVPPTRERVQAAVEASGRAADELIALVPPNFGRATVEKIA